jgi:hypothetical protein
MGRKGVSSLRPPDISTTRSSKVHTYQWAVDEVSVEAFV